MRAAVAALCLVAVACSSEPDSVQAVRVTTSPTVPPTLKPSVAPRPPATATPIRGTSAPRDVTEQQWTPFSEVGGITLRHPSRRVERVAFHQSNHEGAQQLKVLPTAVAPVTLETRDRLTGARTAADVVADPKVEIRAPVTGRVKRAGTYVLYCEHSDDYVVIAPDARPKWEVKLLHIDGVRVRAGDRVEAGKTVLAPNPTKLPFESQVDEIATNEPWPHVHIEVVNPAIPNKPSPGSGC